MATSRPANEDMLSPEQEALLSDPGRNGSPPVDAGGDFIPGVDYTVPGMGPDGPFVDVSRGEETARGRRLRTGICEHGHMWYVCLRLGEHLEPPAMYVEHREAGHRASHAMMARVSGPLAERLLELDRLTTRKNEGYAGAAPTDPWANYNSAAAWGLTGLDSALMRFEEKRNRAATLYSGRGQDKVGESLRETLLDASAIALIAVDMMDREGE